MDEDIRRAIIDGTDTGGLFALAQKKGLQTLTQDGREKVRAGLVAPEELLKAIA